MSGLGNFAKRYEQVQQGLQELAERRLAVGRQSEASVMVQLQELAQRKLSVHSDFSRFRTGSEWRLAWEQLRLLEAKEAQLHAVLEECQERIGEATAEVRLRYQETERWRTLKASEATRERSAEEKKSLQASDDLAVQAHGRNGL
jgi:flagellar biosynthesis chaperone FliJ